MKTRQFISLAERIIAGGAMSPEEVNRLIGHPVDRAFDLLPGADLIREHYFGREVHLCAIRNIKSGRCSEDCSFCAQSAHAQTGVSVYPLLEAEEIRSTGLELAKTPVNRYSVVASGKRLAGSEVGSVARALQGLESPDLQLCASLGTLARPGFEALLQAGVKRYHHNLETAESYYGRVCTTHTYAERVETIRSAKAAGMSVCSGGIFGLGETDGQVAELALTLKKLEVDAVPVNFLIPVAGTPLAERRELSPLRCLKIIALLRFLLPDKDILVCGGREFNLKLLHPLVFRAGASGVMTGDYLTTTGRSLADDLDLIGQLNFRVRR